MQVNSIKISSKDKSDIGGSLKQYAKEYITIEQARDKLKEIFLRQI